MPEPIGPLLGVGRVAEVFEYTADKALKLYRGPSHKNAAFREGAILSLVEDAGISAPRVTAVAEFGGRWGVVMSRVWGSPFASLLLGERPSASYLSALARLQLGFHQVAVPQLSSLKARLASQIRRAPLLSARSRAELLDDLESLPDGDRLCHGDFHPWNVLGEPDTAVVVDWLDATSGPPAADVCRSYILIAAVSEVLARSYIEMYASLGGIDLADVLRWKRVVAGARLAEGVPDDESFLLQMVGGT